MKLSFELNLFCFETQIYRTFMPTCSCAETKQCITMLKAYAN